MILINARIAYLISRKYLSAAETNNFLVMLWALSYHHTRSTEPFGEWERTGLIQPSFRKSWIM